MSDPRPRNQTFKLTNSQVALLISLLWDHEQSGMYWGNKMQHSALVAKTMALLDPKGEYTR